VGGEIISADSRQVYRDLNIGTGKITKKEMLGVPHHLLDVASPRKVFTVHDYVRIAQPVLKGILEKGKSAVICGGTGFYIDALLGRISVPEVPPNRELRGKLMGKSAPQLFAMLRKLDARRARDIDPHNPVRLIRAIEIAKVLGKVPRAKKITSPLPDYEVFWIGIRRTEMSIRKKIHTRLLSRIKAGMVREAKKLHANGLSYKRMDQLGLEYRYLARFLQKQISKEQMLEELEREIFQYAKRQLTYWKRNPDIVWTKRR
jgi:tRNA dimethylallyltransferase